MRFLSKVLSVALLFCGCAADYQVVDNEQFDVVVDSFVQVNKIESIDILVVIDTSGSMSDNFDSVSSGMEELRTDIEALTMDYRFGYITMDPTNLGYLGPYDTSASAIDMLMAPNLLPSAIREEGFAATYSFLNSEEGYLFNREGSDFLLFLISDEDEQSEIGASLFYDWLNDEFLNTRHDVVTVAQTEDSTCDTSWGANVGYEYIELSSLHGKDSIDICDDDWSVWLSSSSYLTERKDSIMLSQTPVSDSIVVYVDNNEIRNWSYNESLNIVYLDSIPDYGSLVEVGYNVSVS
jgi:hypothetical protein